MLRNTAGAQSKVANVAIDPGNKYDEKKPIDIILTPTPHFNFQYIKSYIENGLMEGVQTGPIRIYIFLSPTV